MIVRNQAINIANDFLPDHKVARIKMYSKKWYALMVPRNPVGDFLLTMVEVDTTGTPSMCSNPAEYYMRRDYMDEDSLVLDMKHSGTGGRSLMHYGTPGMKWGTRNYQRPDGTWTELGLKRRRVGSFYSQTSNPYTDAVASKYDNLDDSAMNYNKHMLSVDSLAIGSAAGVTALATSAIGTAFGPVAGLTTGLLGQVASFVAINTITDRIAASNEKKGQIRKHFQKYADLTMAADSPNTKKIKGQHSLKDDILAVNPIGYVKDYFGQLGSRNNCSNCTLAVELRRRGYDVIAGPNYKGNTDDDMRKWFKGKLETMGVKSSKDRYGLDYISGDKLYDFREKVGSTYPEGARFIVNLFGSVGGHTMFGVVQNGQLEFYDGQTRQKMTGYKDSYIGNLFNQYINVIRIDNAELNWDEVKNSVLVAA